MFLQTHGEHLPFLRRSQGTIMQKLACKGARQQPPLRGRGVSCSASPQGQTSPHPFQRRARWSGRQEDLAGFALVFLAVQQQKGSLSMYCSAERRGPHPQRKNAKKGLRHCGPFTAPDTNAPRAQRGKRKK